ncbi:uncharacterized protein V1516DRAFT_672510 [Lipomyces oligophaga]|uniref:uncharacterized protein n=1 Tax=Lipomyces oligophaga TaxID=45792 RepID=UPI0034CE85D2
MDPEKSRLYLYSVPPPYEEDDDDEDVGPSSTSSSSSANAESAAERQSFIPSGLTHVPDGGHPLDRNTLDDTVSVTLSTPRSSTETAADLEREILAMEIIDSEAAQTVARPSLPSRIVSRLQYPFRRIRKPKFKFPIFRLPKFTLFQRIDSNFPFISAFFYSVALRYHSLTGSISQYFNNKLESFGNPILIKRLTVVFLLTLGAWAIVVSDVIPIGNTGREHPAWPPQHYDLESLRQFFFHQVDVHNLATQISELTKFPHITGTNGDLAMAQYIEKYLSDLKYLDKVELKEYEVFLTFPDKDQQHLSLLTRVKENHDDIRSRDDDDDDDNSKKRKYGVTFTANLTEPEAVTGNGNIEPVPFHSFSASGDVTGHLVYANYCSRKDFQKLEDEDINVAGAIVFCRYGYIHESLKIKAAEVLGATGVVLFRDKSNRKVESFPDGPAIPEDAVQRGSAALRQWAPGDPLSVGYASIPNAHRDARENVTSLVNIPSMPISWTNAKVFLNAIRGFGKHTSDSWKCEFEGVSEWWTGSEKGPRVHLVNKPVEKTKQPIWNVISKIEGSEQSEKVVIIGAHRDSWCYGASDAMSGTAVMLEVARLLGYIVSEYAWRPLRSIYFISWDGSEQNLMGSTEWVEENIDMLRRDGVAYINLDQAVSGSVLHATGDPLLESLLLTTTSYLHDQFRNHTLRQLWGNQSLRPTDGTKDTLPFQSFAGIPSIDVGFHNPAGYPTRTCFDNMNWLNTFGDPETVEVHPDTWIKLKFGDHDIAADGHPYYFHRLLAQLVGGMTIRLADEMNIPFDFSALSRSLIYYSEDLEKYVGERKLNLNLIHDASQTLQESAVTLEKWVNEWMNSLMEMGRQETTTMTQHRFSRNSRMVNFEKHLLDMDGTPGRPWFKQALYTPQQWPSATDDSSSHFLVGTFGGIRDAIYEGNITGAQMLLDNLAKKIGQASLKLVT